MDEEGMLTEIDGRILTAAFPVENRSAAILAGNDVARLLDPRQWTERFAVQVGGQTVLIPSRLHFASCRLSLLDSDEAWLFARALQTRSNDGFERQRAARDLLKDVRPWATPFIVDLIGQYVVEILEDISAAMTPESARTMGAFIADNETFWDRTKSRVASYWNAYYRSRWSNDRRRAYRRDEYVGFELVDRLGRAASETTRAVDE